MGYNRRYIPKSVPATGYHLLQQRMNTPSREIVQHECVPKTKNRPFHFVTLVSRDVGQQRIETRRVDDTEKVNVIDVLRQSRR